MPAGQRSTPSSLGLVAALFLVEHAVGQAVAFPTGRADLNPSVVTPANFLVPGLWVDGTSVYNEHFQFFVQPVPEPATVLLLGIGLVALGLYGWRKRNE